MTLNSNQLQNPPKIITGTGAGGSWIRGIGQETRNG